VVGVAATLLNSTVLPDATGSKPAPEITTVIPAVPAGGAIEAIVGGGGACVENVELAGFRSGPPSLSLIPAVVSIT